MSGGVSVRMSIPIINRTEPIPGYKLLERLGSGGFGEVWKCEAPGGILKAIKFVYGDLEAAGDEGTLADREHKALERVKQVRHPFILSLERYDIVEGRLVILTELADCNLWDRFRQFRNQGHPGIPREELLGYLREAAEALDMMNDDHQLQHLDVKPQNLFLMHKHIKVADFGMAKVFEGMRATITGGVTPVYAAPETFEGWISRHCDQYSLAIVYQELLTGVRPFDGANTKQLLLQHLNSPPNLLPLPECDRPVIARALAKKPNDRHPSCLALIYALEQAQAAPPVPRPEPSAAAQSAPSADAPPVARGPRVLPPRPRERVPTTEPAFNLQSVSMMGIPLPERTPVPTETSGTGVLQPTIVVGVGWLGGRVVRRFSAAVIERFGDLQQLPILRLLVLDTDAEAIQSLSGQSRKRFDSRSSVYLRLERPTQYSRREGGPNIDKWLEGALLYRMPRVPATNGIRAFGRLALVDHARGVSQRLQSELEAATARAALSDADRATGLGLRNNRPRVYIVTSLAGGAGSGMTPDLAYLVRAALRNLGYDKSEVIGVLLVPGANARPTALGNACAALTEILQLSQPESIYELRTGSREAPIIDADPPFSRLIAVTLDSVGETQMGRGAVGQAAGMLLGEILAPLGRIMDTARSSVTRLSSPGPVCEVAATYRFAWPRRRLVRRAALRLTERLLRIWTMKDAASVRPTVSAWLEEQWTSRHLQPELLLERLQETCAAAIGQLPEAKFDALISPLVERAALGSQIDAYSACAVLDDIFDLVGKPLSKGQIEPTTGLLQRTVAEQTAAFSAEYDKKLAEMAVHFIEQPGARLAAAEEAIRQLIARLQVLVQTYEGLYLSLERDVADVFRKLFPLIGQLDTGALGTRKSTIANEVLELMRTYPKKRFQAMVAGFALTTYRGMLGAAPEFLREVNYCRERLVEVSALAENAATVEAAAASTLGPGRDLFPGGQNSLEDAARGMVAGLTNDDMANFDNGVQLQVRRQFNSLVSYCLELGGHPGPLLELVEHQAETYLGERLGARSAAEVFFEHFSGDEQAAHRAIAAAVTEAMPELLVRKTTSAALTALAVPSGTAGDCLFDMTQTALPETRVIRAMTVDDLVVYRELGNVPLTELPPFSPAGREAYQRMLASDTPPHSRSDVKWQLPGR
jgi:serine/threonine protein kinase